VRVWRVVDNVSVLARIRHIDRLNSGTQLARAQPIDRIGSPQPGKVLQINLAASRSDTHAA
jgi:hypothetical protein